MPSLYRCRSSSAEIRDLFGCDVVEGMTWRSLVHPGQQGLVIRREGGRLKAANLRWGISSSDEGQRTLLWTEREPFAAAAFGSRRVRPFRCLIVVDSFALPHGPAGQRMRSWFGLWDQPVFAWAGLWRATATGDEGFIGAVTTANPLIRRVGPLMPVILAPADYARWLFGTVKDVLPLWRRGFSSDAMWLEQADELWTSGICIDDLDARRAKYSD